MKRIILILVFLSLAQAGLAKGVGGTFASIDGGQLSVEDWRGQPVLVVNTASQCAFTRQYDNLQKVYDRYRARGLVVLAVPSDDFNQELDNAEDVKKFCELNYALDVPMTDITSVRGALAHPFYKQVAAETGFEPAWNFNKILIAPDGSVAGTWGSAVRPDARAITRQIETFLD
jgi:glutathione peroxidase